MFELTKFDSVKDISTKEYFKDNSFAVDMFESKYAHNKENRKETPAEVFYRNASGLAQFEKDKEYYTNNWFSLMYNDWYRPGGSIISGIGSNRNESTMNCTTIPIEDDTLEAIAKTEFNLMKTAAWRQGMGVELSPLRPRGAKVSNAAEESTGIVPWASKFSKIGDYVGQKGRHPALLLSLNIQHPDIEEFITSKIKRGNIENANISVQITDNFIDSLKNNKPWKLFFETEREVIEKEVDANEIMDLIADTAALSAEPGVQYIDLLRKGSMVHPVYLKTGDWRYKIISSNACCFTEDNVVDTDKGKLTFKEIENRFFNGEQFEILSYNIEEEKYEYRTLEDFHIRENGEPQTTIKLEIEKDNGDIEYIECTPDHKIYTKNRGWVKAVDLLEDDELLE